MITYYPACFELERPAATVSTYSRVSAGTTDNDNRDYRSTIQVIATEICCDILTCHSHGTQTCARQEVRSLLDVERWTATCQCQESEKKKEHHFTGLEEARYYATQVGTYRT